MKPKQLTIHEIWELFLLSKKESYSSIDLSLSILYPKLDISQYSVTEKIEQYVIGLYSSGFLDFEKVVKGMNKNAG